jgi:hypothetical protein
LIHVSALTDAQPARTRFGATSGTYIAVPISIDSAVTPTGEWRVINVRAPIV